MRPPDHVATTPMGVVESDQAIAVLGMQGEAVTQPMWTLRSRLDTLHHELDEMPSFGVGEEDFAVEQEQGIERGVARLAHFVCYHPVISRRKRNNSELRAAHPAYEARRALLLSSSILFQIFFTVSSRCSAAHASATMASPPLSSCAMRP